MTSSLAVPPTIGVPSPESKYLTWWGDECVEQDVHECRIISRKDGAAQTLITLEQINDILQAAGMKHVHHLYNTSFPLCGKVARYACQQ